MVNFQNMVQRLSENARDHKAYNDALNSTCRWIANLDAKVQDCNGSSGDWHTMREHMENIKVQYKFINQITI